MKSFILARILMLLSISTIILPSCKKENDDSSTSKNNEYTYNGVTKEICWIGISPELITDGSYVINILPAVPAEGEGLFGPPEYIYIEIENRFDGQKIDLTNVTENYDWDIEYESNDINFSGYRRDKTIEGDISGGTIYVKRLDFAYSFEVIINLSFTNGKTLKGYYNGTLKSGDIDTEFSTWQ